MHGLFWLVKLSVKKVRRGAMLLQDEKKYSCTGSESIWSQWNLTSATRRLMLQIKTTHLHPRVDRISLSYKEPTPPSPSLSLSKNHNSYIIILSLSLSLSFSFARSLALSFYFFSLRETSRFFFFFCFLFRLFKSLVFFQIQLSCWWKLIKLSLSLSLSLFLALSPGTTLSLSVSLFYVCIVCVCVRVCVFFCAYVLHFYFLSLQKK